MNDAFYASGSDHALDEVFVSCIADEKRNAFGQKRREAGRQIIDDDYALAGFRQRLNHVTSAIACAAGDKHAHEPTICQFRAHLSAPRCRLRFSAGELPTMLNVAYSTCAETELDVGIENIPANNLELIVPNLHRR